MMYWRTDKLTCTWTFMLAKITITGDQKHGPHLHVFTVNDLVLVTSRIEALAKDPSENKFTFFLAYIYKGK